MIMTMLAGATKGNALFRDFNRTRLYIQTATLWLSTVMICGGATREQGIFQNLCRNFLKYSTRDPTRGLRNKLHRNGIALSHMQDIFCFKLAKREKQLSLRRLRPSPPSPLPLTRAPRNQKKITVIYLSTTGIFALRKSLRGRTRALATAVTFQ